MATYDELIGTLQYLLTNKFAPKPEYTRGLLGDGQGNVEVPGRPDRNYVRFNRSATEFFEIFNRTVNPVDNWPVLIGELPWQPGLTQVVDTDWSAFEQSGWGSSIASTSPHAPTHEWPDGAPGSDPVDVYLRSIVPLRGYTLGSGSSTVYVNSYEYEYNATGTVWSGLPGVDMSPIMAATATGTMRYAGVYLDPLTNTLGVVTGTTTVHTDAFEPPRVDFPGGTIPSARIRIYGGQNGILEADMRDGRRPMNPAGAAASLILIADAGGFFTGTTVESALQELGDSTRTYGGISVVGNAVETAIAVAGTPVQVTVFDTNDPANNTTPDHTNDHTIITIAGNYLIVSSATVNSVAGAASRFEMTVQKNNGASTVGALHVDRNIGGGGAAAGSVSMSGIATLAVNDTIEVWIENETNTQNYVVEDITLNLLRVG